MVGIFHEDAGLLQDGFLTVAEADAYIDEFMDDPENPAYYVAVCCDRHVLQAASECPCNADVADDGQGRYDGTLDAYEASC